jgi:hypothetical protein
MAGHLELTDEPICAVEFNDADNGQFVTNGDAYLAGTLRLQAAGPLASVGDQVIEIVNTSDEGVINGTYANEPAAGDHLGFGVFHEEVNYTDHPVSATLFQAVAGDTDGNRDVNGFDIQAILSANKFGTPETADWTEGDFTSDGFVNGFDIQALLSANQFGKGPYASQDSPGAMATVPEPGTIAMLLAGTLCLAGIAWRRRRI